MIKIESTETYGWEAAIRGMRNPLNSWAKSDSYEAVDCEKCGRIAREQGCTKEGRVCLASHEFDTYDIGPNDYDLMKRLRQSGTDHRKFMRMIMVSVDITAPLYWWKEFDTYKVGTVANSCSTMHKIHAKEFTLDDFSHEHLDSETLDVFKINIAALNTYRQLFISCPEELGPEKKHYWWQMIQLLPSSYNQKRTVTMNYEVLANIYKSRKAHKLDEWREGFCDWIKSLPYSEFITGEFDEPDSSIWLASNENK